MRRVRPILFSALLVSMLPIASACGKKGPPLAPLRPAPAAIADLAAARLGDTVRLQFTVPGSNADRSVPADLAYVDVYAVTGTPEGPLGRALTLREIEMDVIYKVLDKHHGDKPKAAAELGIALKTLYNKLNADQGRAAG